MYTVIHMSCGAKTQYVHSIVFLDKTDWVLIWRQSVNIGVGAVGVSGEDAGVNLAGQKQHAGSLP